MLLSISSNLYLLFHFLEPTCSMIWEAWCHPFFPDSVSKTFLYNSLRPIAGKSYAASETILQNCQTNSL